MQRDRRAALGIAHEHLAPGLVASWPFAGEALGGMQRLVQIGDDMQDPGERRRAFRRARTRIAGNADGERQGLLAGAALAGGRRDAVLHHRTKAIVPGGMIERRSPRVIRPPRQLQEAAALGLFAFRAPDGDLERAAVGVRRRQAVDQRQRSRRAALELVISDRRRHHMARPRPGGGGNRRQQRGDRDRGSPAHQNSTVARA